MKRTLLVMLIGTLIPATAAADIQPPLHVRVWNHTDPWMVVGSIAVGLILAFGVWKFRPPDDEEAGGKQ